jgi:hypothetical protein
MFRCLQARHRTQPIGLTKLESQSTRVSQKSCIIIVEDQIDGSWLYDPFLNIITVVPYHPAEYGDILGIMEKMNHRLPVIRL